MLNPFCHPPKEPYLDSVIDGVGEENEFGKQLVSAIPHLGLKASQFESAKRGKKVGRNKYFGRAFLRTFYVGPRRGCSAEMHGKHRI